MSTTKKKKKSARERRVLVASIICAGLIVAGSTFAWFTSTDEVTNRLSASAEYGVAIAESFQPPENWVPGQEINKDAAAVNTGNVDAFVRMWLDGNMRLLKQQSGDEAKWDTTNGFTLTGITNVPESDKELIGAGLNRQITATGGAVTYYKTLNKTQTTNPNASLSGAANGYADEVNGPYSEVQAMQSNRLAYAPANAEYSYVLKEDTSLPIEVSINNAAAVTKTTVVPAGTLVVVKNTLGSNEYATMASNEAPLVTYPTNVKIKSASGSEETYTSTVFVKSSTDAITTLQNVEYESFTPYTNGLYLFLRNEDKVKIGSSDKVEFSGYYVQDASGTSSGYDASGYNFYALDTTTGTNSNYAIAGALPSGTNVYTGTGSASATNPIAVTIADGNITGITLSENLKIFTAAYEQIADNALKWYYVAGSKSGSDVTPSKIYAVYDAVTADNKFTPDTGDSKDIVVEITLANIYDGTNGTETKDDPLVKTAESWQAIGATTATGSDIYTLKNSNDLSVLANNMKFYYKNDVESGDTTARLVEKVKLYDGVTNKAYLAFDFDLNVHLDSVQVTLDENGKELDTAINAAATGGGEVWKDTAATGGATGVAGYASTGDTNEIASITWTASTP